MSGTAVRRADPVNITNRRNSRGNNHPNPCPKAATIVKIRTSLIAAVGLSVLIPAAGCTSPNSKTDEQSYDVTEQVQSLIIDARAAAVTVTTGDGAIKVTETYHYSKDRPRTSHEVSGTALRLTESGCATDELRCTVEFSVQVPAATAVNITAQAGAVTLAGLSSDVTVITEAGAVGGEGLAA